MGEGVKDRRRETGGRETVQQCEVDGEETEC